VLTAVLVAVLVIGALFVLRLLALTRKQKKTIRLLGENIALKAKFTSNISAQMTPALRKLNADQPEVKALLDFSNHIQTLSQLETTIGEPVETEEISLPAFCEELMSQVRGKERNGVVLSVDAPKMSATFNKEYVSHILLHLLNNAIIYTPEGGHIHLDFKKRSVHKVQFIVSNTGAAIPEEKREDVFKPFLEVRDLTKGDGLGLPICQQMAIKMNGDLSIDPDFAKGTRFVLSING
jgi:signal transduction histidine kinase